MSKYFDMLAYLMGKQAGGGGGDITVVSKSISTNGTYTAPSGKAYSPVTVYVPNSYAAGDEGKVVSNGELVAQTSDTVTQNGPVDTTLINSLLVNVPRAITGTFTPTSDLRSVTLTDCIGCTNIIVYPTSGIVTTEAGKTHWGTMIVNGKCEAYGATNGNATVWALASPGSIKDGFNSTTGTLSIGYGATQNYGGYFAAGMSYGYAAW